MSILLTVLLQAAAVDTATPPAPPVTTTAPERFSILVPVANEPCTRKKDADVVVCGNPLPSQRLPYPDLVDTGRGRPSNPHLTGARALELQNAPCAVQAGGCGGAGIPILGMALWAGKLIAGAVGDATKAKPDKSKRVAIPLDDPVVPAKAP
ncbi:MAG: hypothetical protein C0476_09780 [Sphingomonas sp.]|nr:hypothetical protein [Sphingomonas sp.]